MTHALSRLLPKHLESRLARCGADQLVRNGAPGFEFATAMHAVEKAEILEKRKVIESITQSIREANSDYEDYSGGNWLSDYGVEGFLVAHIARNLIPLLRESNPNALLTLEETFGAIFHHASGSGTPGPVPAILAPNSRADIVLWESRETVSGVIEVKRKWTTQYCLRDLRRLSRLIERCGTKKGGHLKFACFVCFIAKARDPRLERMKRSYKDIKQIIHEDKEVATPFRYHTLEPVSYSHPTANEYQNYACGGLIVEFY